MSQLNFLREKLKIEVFTDKDLKALSLCSNNVALLSMLSRALRAKKIHKIKRGVYMFSENLRQSPVSKLNVANKIYFPSYISLESALSYHGLIPEGVYVTTSACQQRKKKNFKTPLGDFSYDYIPCVPFFIGVESIQMGPAAVLVANPIKALFDWLYVSRRNYGAIDDLEKDLRMDPDELRRYTANISYKELEVLARSYRKKNIDNFLKILSQEMK